MSFIYKFLILESQIWIIVNLFNSYTTGLVQFGVHTSIRDALMLKIDNLTIFIKLHEIQWPTEEQLLKQAKAKKDAKS